MDPVSMEKFKDQLLQIAQSIELPVVDRSPGEISALLNSFRWAIQDLIKNLNQASETDAIAVFSEEDILRIDVFFSELADNFFPMAHSHRPIKDLRIRDVYKYVILQDRLKHEVDRVEDMKQRLEKIAYDFQENNRR